MSRTRASIAAETERLRTDAARLEQASAAADAAGQYDTGTDLLVEATAKRDRLNWLHQR
jgi:hypothetical protein